MTISDYHFYHGAALSLIVSRGEFTGLARIKDAGSAAFAVNHDIAVYVKHATNSSSPWQFNFHPEHQEAIRNLFNKYKEKTFIALVCGKVGVCLLEYGEYAAVIDENFKEQEGLYVEKPEGGGFRVQGGSGKLNKVMPLNRFPIYIFEK
ncbi:MAG: hypothetical protein HY790_14735 [Deltaproteobacteria bacterium]|nr:hypothetical protein [Deltaproteobacteria bacterium]